MTRTTRKDVEKLAALARLSLPEESIDERAAEFDRIVSYISQLEELSLDTTYVSATPPLRNVFREDGEPTPPGTWSERLVGRFPSREGDTLSVKRIISHD